MVSWYADKVDTFLALAPEVLYIQKVSYIFELPYGLHSLSVGSVTTDRKPLENTFKKFHRRVIFLHVIARAMLRLCKNASLNLDNKEKLLSVLC